MMILERCQACHFDEREPLTLVRNRRCCDQKGPPLSRPRTPKSMSRTLITIPNTMFDYRSSVARSNGTARRTLNSTP